MYATQQNLIDRFGEQELIQLTDRAIPATGAIDTQVLAGAIADADAEIDAYLAGRYTLPLDPIPPVLTRVACDIVRYRLYDNHATEEVRNRYNDAVKFLTGLSKGDIKLGAEPPSAAGAPEYSAPERLFTHDTMRDF